ncbi:restriction endonuclease [Desulfobacterales bacterium HSG17]|nr:restriction endonuclease [Desulfobacterales bacterium HSG17]
MATDSEYQNRIKDYQWKDLSDLWESIKRQNTSGWDDGKAFEYLILQSFLLEGAEIRWPYRVKLNGTEIEQVDGVIYLDNLACLIECKDYNSSQIGKKRNINFEPVTKIRSQLMRRPSSTIACVFSSGGFTEPAITLANFTHPQTILLWTGSEVEYCLGKKKFSKSLINKYRKCIEFGIHDYDITIEEEL